VWVTTRNTYPFPYSYAHTESTRIYIYVCMYHNVHALILSEMYIHVHTCVHVHTYVVFIRTYVYIYIYVCTHMCTLTHILFFCIYSFFVCTYKSIQRIIFWMTNKSTSCDTNEMSSRVNSCYQTHESIIFYSPYLFDHVSKHSGPVPPRHGIR